MPVTAAGLEIDEHLASFVATELLPGLELSPEYFWETLAGLQYRFGEPIRAMLVRRDELQAALDDWHAEHGGGEPGAYRRFLTELGYLTEPPRFAPVALRGVDPEIATVAGPQLVVPATVPRYALNAANARWGSLFDALYGTDVIPQRAAMAPGYDPVRGGQVIAEADRLLDELFPLAEGSHSEAIGYEVADRDLVVNLPQGSTTLADRSAFAGSTANAVLLRRHGLHVELRLNRQHSIGAGHHAGVSDVLLESAVTTIVDLEDSVATVDGQDKAAAYRTWLGLMTGRLTAAFEKDGRTVIRRQNPDRRYSTPDGGLLVLPGRALLLARTAGHHLFTNAVRTADGAPVAEGILDALVVAVAALHDLRGLGKYSNSRAGSIYLVKPKLHGPDEVALTVSILGGIEAALGLPTTTIKVGIMDEEKRTSLNLEACIAAARERIIFINTGFLDRTGDEIHSDFCAGPLVRKQDMKTSAWLRTYEDRNVDVALAAGFHGQCQVGKGMWAKPAAMAEMLVTKIEHPLAGANCAWVPSPTAATLHALHYLLVDVAARQRALAGRHTDPLGLLEVPVLTQPLSAEQIDHELRLNAQSILGYVVRWVGMGVGCSTVPDLDGVGLMEDRATLRISSQLIANWLHHGLVSEEQVRHTFVIVAALVDRQNAGEPGYPPMLPDLDASEAFQAALDLVFTGREEPNGYTERVLTLWRRRRKAALAVHAV